MLMGFKPSPYVTTREMKRIENFLKGDPDDKANPFRWSEVVLNLPGSAQYNSSLPWVYKRREDGRMAGELFIYIDDLRITGVNETECWDGAHQVACRMSWLGLQDAPRKRRKPSTEPGAWAGTVIHSSNGTVTVLVGQKKWDKAKRWINWMSDAVKTEGGIDHKELKDAVAF